MKPNQSCPPKSSPAKSSPLKLSSLELSPIVAGMWRLDKWNFSVKQRQKFINNCVDLGVTSFDHADIYGDYQCEALFGQAIKGQTELRQKIQIVSKCGIRLISNNRPNHRIKRYDSSYQHIIDSVDNSLRLLATDYLDCLLIHRPDPLMDATEVGRAFNDLRSAGKILSAGVSNFLPHQRRLLQSGCDFELSTNQIEISVLQTNSLFDGSLDDCQQNNIVPMAWSPLASGELFSPANTTARSLSMLLGTIAKEYSCTIDQVALAWLFRHPSNIKPVVGTGNLTRMQRAIEARKIAISDQQWFEILQVSRGKPVR